MFTCKSPLDVSPSFYVARHVISRHIVNHHRQNTQINLRILNLLQTVLELRPMRHDDIGPSLLEHTHHLLLLLLALITTHIANDINAGTRRAQRATLTILNGNALLRILTNDLASMQVNGRIRLGGRMRQRRGGAENVIFGEVLVLPDFLDGSLHAPQGRRRHDRHAVFLGGGQFLQHGVDADARLRFLPQRRDHAVFFRSHVVFQLGGLHGEVVFLLQAAHHAAEVLAHEGVEELRAGESIGLVLLLEDFIGELGAGFEGEFFGENEGIVAVEEEFCDLRNLRFTCSIETVLWSLTFGMMADINCQLGQQQV